MDLAAIYQKPVLDELKRFLSLQDREPLSPSSGCFDRTYWCWKFTDFPGARFQEGVYSLAHLYTHSFPGNDLAANPNVLTWARAGFQFWQKIQYKDGSFDEAYPYERSLAAVAFTGFYLGEAFLLLKDKLPKNEVQSIKESFTRAGDWLCNNDEKHGLLSNHLAAAAAALCVISQITGERRFLDRMNFFLSRIFQHQSSEGWYEEYGGADPGYQTHATFYLARIWQYTKSKELLESLRKSVQFLQYFVHPNGTLGGEYASRNTEFYYPAGLEILAEKIPEAAAIAGFMRSSVSKQQAAGLAAMDAYNFFPLLNNYLFASLNAKAIDESGSKLSCKNIGEHFFSHAGLHVKSSLSYYAISGLSKGGTLKVYEKKTGALKFCDSGYYASVNGRVLSNQSFSRLGEWKISDSNIELHAPFYTANRKPMRPWLFLGFRGFMLTLGQLPGLSYWVKKLLVKVLVNKRTKTGLSLHRKTHFEDSSITITDELSTDGSLDIQELKRHPKFATIHMGSSRYFQSQDLSLEPEAEDKARELMVEKRIFITRKITL